MLKLILLASCAWALSACNGSTVVTHKTEAPLINTTGSAEKFIDPNMLVISIETYGKSELAKKAQELQAIEYNRIKSAMDKFKIKSEDFITENMTLSPEYRYDEKTQSQKTVGFRASHQIRIVIREIKQGGDLIDEISSSHKLDQAGVNISSIEWDNDTRKAVAESLIAAAVADARKKADLLASASEVKIIGVQSLNYAESSYAPPAGRMLAKSMMADAGGVSTELGKGAIKIRTDVNVQYKID